MADVKNDLKNLYDVISGEKALRKRESELKKAKEQAIKEQKGKRRKAVVDGSVKLKKESVQRGKKVVQNIKVFEWEANDRYQIRYNDKGFLLIVALSLVFILLLAVLEQYAMMAAIIAILFLMYVSATTKPVKVKHKITTRGIDTFDKLYEWYMLDSFYFCQKDDTLFLLVETKLNIPRVLMFLVPNEDKDAIFVLLQDKLLYKDIRKQGRLDKISYGEYIPLEKI